MAKKPAPAKTAKSKAPAKAKDWTVEEVLRQLKALGHDGTRAHNAKNGAGDNQFGVKRGDIRTLANKIKTNHELALALWQTGNLDAQFLATLLLNVEHLSLKELESMVKSVTFGWLADWLHSYVVKLHADKESLREKGMKSKHPMLARAGWQLTAGRVAKSPDGLDLAALLDRIEAEMSTADPMVQWTMNACLAEIGIHFPKHRKRALAIGETLGVYRDYPCAKGCTSPFAPIWIAEMVKRQG